MPLPLEGAFFPDFPKGARSIEDGSAKGRLTDQHKRMLPGGRPNLFRLAASWLRHTFYPERMISTGPASELSAISEIIREPA